MLYIRSGIFVVFLVTWTIIVGVFGLVTLLTFDSKKISFTTFCWAKGVLAALKLICMLSYKVKGVQKIPKSSAIYACKHQSAWETIFFLSYFRCSAYILKKELVYIPIYGWYLPASGMICVDRKGGASALKQTIAGVRKALGSMRNIIIFPEGTRVEPGQAVDLKPGIAAIHSFVPEAKIVPVALNSGYFWPKKSFLIRPGTITIEFLEPIRSKMKKDELLQNIKDRINYASNALKNGYNLD